MRYPIKFEPILQEKIWGGQKLVTELGKNADRTKKLGESWEISAVKGFESVVSNGSLRGKRLPDLIDQYQSKLVGQSVFETFGNKFPLLIKFIDAAEDLSVQLHPNDKLATTRHQSFGKTEMWYIMNADTHTKLNLGFNNGVTKSTYIQALNNGELLDILHFQPIEKDQAFFIVPGTVHSIGAGTLLAEIQQTSDITYRVYDWDRTDANGNTRELHTDLAIDAINFESADYQLNVPTATNQALPLAKCRYFNTNIINLSATIEQNYHAIDSFIILICVDGQTEITIGKHTEQLQRGETVLIPACIDHITLTGNAKLLEVWV